MSDTDATLPMSQPPISSSPGLKPQETLLQRGALEPPVTPGMLGTLDRFEILRLLGEGGMGQVYLAREPRTDTLVAVKILRPQMANDPQSVHRFLTEARHMYRLSHPRILRVLEVSDRRESPYYGMPYIEGGSLLGQCRPELPMPAERVLAVGRQVAAALAHAHAHGLIHRDLKPGNVLLDKDGNAYLTDFGLVRTVFNDSMVDTSASHLEGTAPYMSPAVARGEAEDTRCDIYAFGALLYELLTGQPPYSGRTPQLILDQVLKGPPPPVREVNPKASPALVKIAEGCMARELRDRYASMADVVSDFERVDNGLAPFGPHRQQRSLPRLAALLAGTLALATLAGAAVRHFSRQNPPRPEVAGHSGGAGSPSTLPVVGGLQAPLPSGTRFVSPQKPGVQRPVSSVPAQTNAPAVTGPFPFAYTTNNGTVTISKYNGPGGAVVIPKEINGLPVTVIGDGAFMDRNSVTNVTIPNSVIVIGAASFHRCRNLASVTIGDSVTRIGDRAFEGCTNLVCATMPHSVTYIGHYAFVGCKLTSVTIPNKVTRIGSWAFGFCPELTTGTISASVTSMGWEPFKTCCRLASIRVDAANPVYSSSEDGVLFNKEKTILIDYPGGKAGRYVISNNVSNIFGTAFWDCTNLTSVTIPASVNAIDGNPFVGCNGLTSVVVDAANTRYRSSEDGVLFDKEKNCLVEYPGGKDGDYVIPDGVTRIGASAFANCTKLSGVRIPNSVTNIEHMAFGNCTKLASVYFKGDAPRGGSDSSVFGGSDKATVYYLPGAKDWGPTFGGRPTAVWESPATPSGSPATAGAGVTPGEKMDLKRDGAFGFPQAEARVLCEEPDLRVSVWNDAKHLFVQAIVWRDGDDSLGEGRDGRQVGDDSDLALDVDADQKKTPNVDRRYSLNPWPYLPGLRYQVILDDTTTTTLKGDSKGRGSIRYVPAGEAGLVRVDTYVIPLDEIGKRPGEKIRLAYFATSPKPQLVLNSVGCKRSGMCCSDCLPMAMYHEVTLSVRAETIDPKRVPDGREDKAR